MSQSNQKYKEQLSSVVDEKYQNIPVILEREKLSVIDSEQFHAHLSQYQQRLKADVENYNSSLSLIKKQADNYNRAISLMKTGEVTSVKQAIEIFTSLENYKDSSYLLQQCNDMLRSLANEKINRLRFEALEAKYNHALSLMNETREYIDAAREFEELGQYKDSPRLQKECLRLAKRTTGVEREVVKKGNPQNVLIEAVIFVIGVALIVIGVFLTLKIRIPYTGVMHYLPFILIAAGVIAIVTLIIVIVVVVRRRKNSWDELS